MVRTAAFALPDGLVLRAARPVDLAQIGELLSARGDESDATDHRLVVEDPDLGCECCAVVVDGDRVVSTALLLDETLRVGDVTLSAGQVELVATQPAYEGRGLVRALMHWAHTRSHARGHVLQVMIGIPYFYRLFGYEYAIDMPAARKLADPPVAGHGFRRAAADDIPVLTALQDAAQRTADVAMPHPAARWRWLLQHESSSTWVVERDGVVVASARVRAADDDVLVAEAAAVDARAADQLLSCLVDSFGEEMAIVHRPGTVTGSAWEDRLAGPRPQAEQYYVRLPAPELLLDLLRPLMYQRLVAAGVDRVGKDVVISTFGRHYRMPVTATGLGPVQVGGPMQGPGAVGGAGVAPDHLAALLLGPLGIEGLTCIRPDVYAGPDAELFTALFPPTTADLLTYYLPW